MCLGGILGKHIYNHLSYLMLLYIYSFVISVTYINWTILKTYMKQLVTDVCILTNLIFTSCQRSNDTCKQASFLIHEFLQLQTTVLQQYVIHAYWRFLNASYFAFFSIFFIIIFGRKNIGKTKINTQDPSKLLLRFVFTVNRGSKSRSQYSPQHF